MGTPTRERRLGPGGIWRYVTVNANGNSNGGSQPQFLTIGPIPIAFNSTNIGTTGFPVLDVLEGDIVCGFGCNVLTGWDADDGHLGLFVTNSSGVACVNEGTVSQSSEAVGDADALTISSVFDGWTLILNDTQLVAKITDPTNSAAGASDLYITILRPVAP